ncbi:hypothetical protein NK718_09710 [Alsobacter sp. SYSU M60028]|uniref:Uncharacterized protein n=1 Tax=Alsobacter ponti TaxID=2962936 RepID=A0ABT1LBC1_9HYPH|nr:hypothetical protein [Alsobacter ponti]MCP8938789.1 hypothetical protein [Alsobacter ponti]
MVRSAWLAAAWLSLALAGGPALAQDATQPPTLPVQPGNPQTTIPEKVDPKAVPKGETTGSTLSEQLKDSKGVIKPPPGVDPEIHVPAPEVGRMPVIPPPGSPGGAKDVQPR